MANPASYQAWRTKKHDEADAEVLQRPTFGSRGSLKSVNCLPSTLGYRERVLLAKDPLLCVEIGRIYQSEVATAMPVWDRLCTDAAVRRGLPGKQGCEWLAPSGERAGVQQPAEAAAAAAAARGGDERHALSGRSFVNNNSSALAEAQERRRRTEAAAQEPQLDALHLLTLRSYKKKFPLDFMAAARPRAQTTNQTLHMAGLYEEDGFLMAKMGVQPAVGVTPGAFLPDMRRAARK